MSRPTPPASESRRGLRQRRLRRRTRARALIAGGSALLLIVVAGVVWFGFLHPSTAAPIVAMRSPTSTATPIPTPTATMPPRQDMAPTPPMGWNSWNQVGCTDLTAQVVYNAVDAIVASGLKAAGYQYVVVDDCWQAGRDANGNLIPDPTRFPDGMAAVANYVHAHGLKFGIYAVPGSQTCGNYFSGYPVHGIGSLGHEQQDADTFASWGVDYLKYDWCRADINDKLTEQSAFQQMEKDLDATGRPIVLSISEYGQEQPWLWASGIANLWRTTHDIHNNWTSVMQHIDAQVPITQYAHPGAWNDPDMLEVGNGLTPTEDISHFAMWCMLAAPLFIGTDVSALPSATIGLITNPELVAIDQDALGKEAHQVSSAGGIQIWERPLVDGSYAVALFNTTSGTRAMSTTLAALGIPAGSYSVRDVVARADDAPTVGTVSGSAPAHGIVTLKLTPTS
ncbi:MAG: glycoside hydrolase family 27 protein [Galbitalea sp.]